MGRILMYVVLAVIAFFVAGWFIGMVLGLLKWALIIAVIAGVGFSVLSLFRSCDQN